VSGPPAAAETLDFETAYCLYRLHREREALAALERIADRGGRERHLEAQVVRTVDRIRS
jgi:signal recognition particle subunit SRP72